jgi:UDP-galactopyranose mutase
MPKDGYTKMFERMLKHKKIEVVFNTDYKSIMNDIKFNKMIYTGPIDYFFDYEFGRLPYRSIRFDYERLNSGYYQSTAQVNYVDENVAYTRVVEHKYLSGQDSSLTTVSREYSQSNGEPFYPIPADKNRELYLKYLEYSKVLSHVYFCGRLAEYQYYNMDQVVGKTINFIKKLGKRF